MSLLNQVLQDLEKRNAESTPDLKQLSKVKAVFPAHNKSVLYLTAFLLLAIIIAIASYFMMDNVPSETKSLGTTSLDPAFARPQKSATKSTIENFRTKKTPNSKQITIETDIQPPAIHQINEVATTQPIKNHAIDDKTQQQSIKTAPKIIKKNIQINQRNFSKKLSNKQQAEKTFTLAKKQKNNPNQQEKLRQTLQLNPQHIEARLLLANSLLNKGMTSETIAVLDQGLQLFPLNIQFINFRSQLFLQNKQPQAALNILQRINSDDSQDEMYLSLLAAAYQQNNDNLNSLKTYQKLLSINSEKAEYWLGLAIAYEKQGNAKQALNAYQYALNKKTLKSAIVSYINQRVSLLK